MVQKCVHRGCGKNFTDSDEECIYHSGPPVFHEGQKGWECCKPRVLTFDEFLEIPPCTTGKHSTVEDIPNSGANLVPNGNEEAPAPPALKPLPVDDTVRKSPATGAPQSIGVSPVTKPITPESDSDDPSTPIQPKTTCKRRGCNAAATTDTSSSREGEQCVYHPGQALFHEGNKGWTCCNKRVLEFDEFMKIEGCKQKTKHLFVGSKKDERNEEAVQQIRHDYYQTSANVIASLFLKKIDKEKSKIVFTSPTTISVDLHTADNKRYKTEIPLFGAIDVANSTYKIMATKLEFTLTKLDGASWATFRSDEQRTNEIIQVGRAGRA